MSMYGVNSSIPKTLVRHLVGWIADNHFKEDICPDGSDAESRQTRSVKDILMDIIDTPISPELLPADGNGNISQKTEDLVGPYELHDFFLYNKTFMRRFFSQQFKRSCLPDGPKVGSVTLSPRGDWRMPSDASAKLFI